MNSELIKARFGTYFVRILRQDDVSRVASLCSRHGNTDICRTLAVTRFAKPLPSALTAVDTLIRQGHSIGSTLEKAGQNISREVIAESSAPCGDNFSVLTGQSVEVGDLLYLRVYGLHVGSDVEAPRPYATIAEAHHPEHTPPSTEAFPVEDLVTDIWSNDARLALKTLLAALL